MKGTRCPNARQVTIVPLKVYFKNGFVKVLVGVGRGKRQYDKRDSIKAREQKREMTREMNRRRR